MMTFEQYADWLTSPQVARQTIFDMGNGKVVYIESMMFHWALKTSEIGNMTESEGRWCYEGSSPIRVLTALEEWKSRNYEGKPTGWLREPYTGLRRNEDGDPATERYAP